MKKVELFVVGNSKSGTSALCDYLDQHPDLCLSDPKEPNYFADDFTHAFPEGAFYRLSPSEYERCYERATPGQKLVDGSACYLYSHVAAQAIYDYNPDARIVAIFREPVDFLLSYHLQMLRNVAAEGEVIRELGDALAAEADRKEGKRIPAGCRVPAMLFYRDRIRYAEQLQRFIDVFPSENIRVYLYDEFRSDNAAVVRDVYSLVGVEPDFHPSRTEVNQASRTRAPRLARAVQDLAHGRGAMGGLNKAIKSVVPTAMRRRVLGSVTDSLAVAGKGEIDAALREQLMTEFRQDVVEFGEILGRDLLEHWGYATVGGAVK